MNGVLKVSATAGRQVSATAGRHLVDEEGIGGKCALEGGGGDVAQTDGSHHPQGQGPEDSDSDGLGQRVGCRCNCQFTQRFGRACVGGESGRFKIVLLTELFSGYGAN